MEPDDGGLRLAWAPVPPDRAQRREVARDLLRGLLAAEGWPEVAFEQACPHCGGAHGPLHVTGAPWRASVSYAGGLAVAGVYPATAPGFAIDAEPLVDPTRDAAGIPGGLLRWVRVEATLKADSRGLRVDPAVVSVAGRPGGWTATIPGRVAVVADGWEPTATPPGILVSAAILSPRRA
ncbi:MAG: hypothetical protein ABS62_04160 [Microbacterium sp. SCN 70-200]|uniref:chemotaxis protein CheY n=1 Tax=unclassified Microbacterium TaxID=2609290 RepID=UPI00086C04A2|nr:MULTISPECIES: chemotaxis protein CheY [unclassified Microbacterium]MBN9213581.1 chemotaxis protein CheY [Microbacterium sp.]ODT42267.1 MAG: hypothetical protein ABS62_04160 [Microbacterium sp. SCN 70-200]OJV79104.1 MAG: hypothetical protein BGO46_02180 [Microbacterium sp. 70-16]